MIYLFACTPFTKCVCENMYEVSILCTVFYTMFRNLVRGLNGGVVKRDVGDNGGNTAGEISDLRNSMEIMMENINHLVTKQQVGKLYSHFSYFFMLTSSINFDSHLTEAREFKSTVAQRGNIDCPAIVVLV